MRETLALRLLISQCASLAVVPRGLADGRRADTFGLWTLPQRTQALHGLLDGEVGLFSQS